MWHNMIEYLVYFWLDVYLFHSALVYNVFKLFVEQLINNLYLYGLNFTICLLLTFKHTKHTILGSFIFSGSSSSKSSANIRRYRPGISSCGSSHSSSTPSVCQTPRQMSSASRIPGSRRTPHTASSATPAMATPSVNNCTAIVGNVLLFVCNSSW